MGGDEFHYFEVESDESDIEFYNMEFSDPSTAESNSNRLLPSARIRAPLQNFTTMVDTPPVLDNRLLPSAHTRATLQNTTTMVERQSPLGTLGVGRVSSQTS